MAKQYVRFTCAVLMAWITVMVPNAANGSAEVLHTILRVPLEDFTARSCGEDAEVVTFSGTIVVRSHATYTPAGVQVFVDGQRAAGIRAVGEDGTRYRLQYRLNSVTASGSAYATTFHVELTVRASGPRNDAVFRTLSHFTYNANGSLATEKHEHVELCR